MSDGLQDAGIQLAETLQTAHINHNPDPTRDFAPQTSVDKKVPVRFDRSREASSDVDDVGEDEVPLSVLRPLPEEPWAPRHMQLPDLRFEQSYLKSISDAKDWKVVTYITIKDQVRGLRLRTPVNCGLANICLGVDASGARIGLDIGCVVVRSSHRYSRCIVCPY